MIKIDSIYSNNCFVLENDLIKISILSDFGAKVASFKYKPKNIEFVFQPTKKSYTIPSISDDFSIHDTSGIDDCFPTIDKCVYKNFSLNDHGDIWSSKPFFEIKGDKLISNINTPSMPFLFTKTFKLSNNKLVMNFTIKNLKEEKLPFLYAFHGLMDYRKNLELFLPDDDILNVIDGREYDFDFTKLDDYRENESYKFYLKEKLNPENNNLIGILDKNNDVFLNYTFDKQALPYLGVWFTKGGFKGEKNVAIEMCSGFYDSLSKAVENEKVTYLEGKGTFDFEIELEVIDNFSKK